MSRKRLSRRFPVRLGLIACLIAVVGLTGATSASAVTTIGQIPTTPPSISCSGNSFDQLQPTVTSGTSYVVPEPGVITAWSTYTGQYGGQMTMKVFRLVSGLTYKVVGHDGPRNLIPNTLQTFQSNVPVQAGDILGLSNHGTTTHCGFSAPGETGELSRIGSDLNDGETGIFQQSSNFRTDITAELATKPSNDFNLGKLKKNKEKGTALLTVDVPGPGTVDLTGAGIKPQRSAGGARVSRAVDAAGPVTLRIKARGAKKFKLKKTGKVQVQARVTYTPSGELPGNPKTETKPVKLIDKEA